ncbi:hypothetical protein LCGC14_1804450, partial [marine sediment metagenome]
LIGSLILVVILALFLAWKKISPERPERPVIEFPIAPEDSEEEAPSAPAFQLTKLSDDGLLVFDYWSSPRDGEVYYLTLDGKVLNAKKGPDPDVSTRTITALNFIDISPDGKKILVAFGDPKNPDWSIFDVLDKVWRPLALPATYAMWGENSNKLIGIVQDSDSLYLSRIDLSKILSGETVGAYETLVNNFQLYDVVFTYLSPNILIIKEKPASFYASRVWQLTLDTLDLKLLMAPERGIITKWVQDANIVFKFSLPSQFFILNRDLANIIPVFFASLPSKCGVGDSYIYCFSPQEFPPELPNTQMPDDYFQKRFYTIDSFYTIDRASNKISLILNSNTSSISAIDAEAVKVFGGKIYFINRYDQGLYRIILNPVP